ncbi:UDP-N-acetylmuramoyl-tripeptide--D-alanyl-D-alanine ligase [Candidatus Saccharibacteria bacterium]|nr:UDP-N-acetylmuramoyl-tripeptide--D-alanyl-D-alanine ligase [Candidatus Saccharibacteria bacterium]
MKKIPKKVIASRLSRGVKKLLKTKTVSIVIVTGSVGKTSAKVAIGKLLGLGYQVGFSEDSYNTNIGLPLSFFGLKAPAQLWDPIAWRRIFQKIRSISRDYPYDVVVLEMADDEVEDMLQFLSFIKPEYGVVTAVAPVHMERMLSIDKIVRDNWRIASGAKEIIYNADQPELAKLASKNKKTFGFGLTKGDVRFLNINTNSKGYFTATLKLPNEEFEITTKMIGKHNLYSLLIAASVANQMGMSGQKIAKGLASIGAINGRMNLLAGVNGSKIIDDSYNASPQAVCSALDVLSSLPTSKRIAVLGNMNELGEHSIPEHYKVGKYAAKRADILVVIGKDAELHMVNGAKEAGMNPDNIKIFKSPYEIGHFLKRIVDKNDVILVKGSQNGIFLEEAVRILLDPSLDAKEVLVRQNKSWKRKKRKAFGL